MTKWMVVVALALGAIGCDTCKRAVGQCCKVCKDGKACGDSCIASGSTCSQPGGCACNGATALEEAVGVE